MKFGSLSLSEAQTLGRCNRPVVAGRLRADLTEFERSSNSRPMKWAGCCEVEFRLSGVQTLGP